MNIKKLNEELNLLLEATSSTTDQLMTSGNEIHFATEEAKALWETEILGQLSDGMWENARPLDHYKFWTQAAVVVDGQIGYRANNDSPKKTNYNLGSLIPDIGERMRAIVSASKLGKDPELAIDLVEFADRIKYPEDDEYWIEQSNKVKAEFGEDVDVMTEKLLDMTSERDLRGVLREIKTMFNSPLN